ncbi:glycoside hydrolase family 9 protein [Thermophagus sp. OGC60D27]|uniref:glycoside hydrolase family 9 protein n=1 Tax=Thermophagus sp. OGC60D27 TaxID=3458415 RepID=UPI00403779C1
MKTNNFRSAYFFLIALLIGGLISGFDYSEKDGKETLVLNDSAYYEAEGVNILMFSNWYNGYFSDSKMSGIEVIHHGKRTVTNGDVRLNHTPEQWDPIPKFVKKEVDSLNHIVKAWLEYPNFGYMIRTQPQDDDLLISVHLDNPLPAELEGKAGFNLEFLPAAYFEKTYLMDGKAGIFPLYPSGPTTVDEAGNTVPVPLADGHRMVLAPEDDYRRITVESEQELLFFDGRNKAQNGWFVLRSLIPSGKKGKVIEWRLHVSAVGGWLREPVISFSQVGYHPSQMKQAVIELDRRDKGLSQASLLKVDESGNRKTIFEGPVKMWGQYHRYQYGIFDFSDVSEPGLYVVKYGDLQSRVIRVDKDVYEGVWHPTLDIYMPVQMDHVLVNEAYRVWHGASHLDDALQAPVNHEHFDLYAQGPTTDSPYRPGEHIPGLNIGGWYDAGDYDIRTQSQYHTVLRLVHAWEDFDLFRDETLVDQENRFVDLHHPDGKNDILQQIEHGALALVAQHRAVGHAIPGIIVPYISQYTHLGDGLTMTDNLIFDSSLDSLEVRYPYSGTFDDRWAFTSKSTPLNYGSASALAAASRALQEINPELARECLETAVRVWNHEQGKEPDIFYVGNTTGGPLLLEELRATTELLITTGEEKYAGRIRALWPDIRQQFGYLITSLFPALPYMDEAFVNQVKERTRQYAETMDSLKYRNPFGVPITEGGWAGNETIIENGVANYMIYKAFPDVVDKESVFRAINYILGCHPGSDISFVSGVGLHSKKVAYGMNRADFSFIAGGIVPGVLILKPDYPENKEDWPFLWGENEYVITVAGSFIYLANAVQSLVEDL